MLVILYQLLVCPVSAGETHPLQPIDTSSPRATLQGFLEAANEGFAASTALRQSYLSSSRLYFLPEEIAAMRYTLSRVESAERALDLSELPSATVSESSRRLVVQMKEILDRIDLPPLESVPDEQAMAKAEFKRWTLPGTEIRIARIEKGARTGEYLFTPETVGRIPEFYLKVKPLPYKPGASVGWYDLIMNSPTGVVIASYWLLPPRWVFNAASGMQSTFLDQPLWRWVGIVIVFVAGGAAIGLCHRLSRRWAERQRARLLLPLGVVLVTSAVVSILAQVLRVSGVIFHAATLTLWTLFYLALTWLVWVAGSVVAENVIAYEKLRASSIDSQLIRLALRLLTIVLAVAILATGADRVGLPAYSVIAGLGVGGLAVALAAQQTLANLLGSIIIMVEKPFAIGHWIKIKDIEGVVEDVGFRSTRIRTFYDSLVTVPSSQMVSSTVDNMELREYRRVKTVLSLAHDTPAEKIEAFIEAVRQIVQTHADTRKDNIQVVFNELGPHSLDILLEFFLKVPDRTGELSARQKILLEILRLAEATGVRFAFPTQTLHIESLPIEMPAPADVLTPSS